MRVRPYLARLISYVPGFSEFAAEVEAARADRAAYRASPWLIDPLSLTNPLHRKLLLNVERELASAKHPPALNRLLATLNIMLLRGHPDVFDPWRVITAPVTGETETGDVISVTSTTLKTEIRPGIAEPMDGALTTLATAVKQDELAYYVKEIADELRGERDRLALKSRAIYPYVPIGSYGSFIDPHTFEPFVRLVTRYAIAAK